MIHPDTELRHVNGHIGHGVFATQLIPKGTVTWALDPLDQVLSVDQEQQLRCRGAALLDKYTYRNRTGQRVLLWDLARWMNHSCAANTLSPGLDFELAIRDILPGEEITCDYGALNEQQPFECACDSRQCRITVRPEDFDAHACAWDALLRDAFGHIREVPQPLWKWVRDRSLIERALLDPALIPSTMDNKFVPRGRNGVRRLVRTQRRPKARGRVRSASDGA